eukprot:TRINITY_DN1076_c0_g1_i22.p1 TRINITY_DN1076_c0_g1~~TRINITY_DN1076_c0_g1_i22.p1  ORF type:complete len:284 (-),score=-9.20 TRINITY_DN1076_c0_g1_i22:271-1095(-)
MIRRPPRSTLSSSSAASDVYKRQILADASEENEILEKASDLLASMTNLVVLTANPSDCEAKVRHIQFIITGRRSSMIIMMTSSGLIKNKNFKVDYDVTPDILRMYHKIFNGKFSGMALTSITPALVNNFLKVARDIAHLLQVPCITFMAVCREALETDVNLKGQTNLLYLPGIDIEEVKKILTFLNTGDNVAKLLSTKVEDDDIKVMIGTENNEPELRNTSVVITKYDLDSNEETGKVAIIGPTRMDYEKMMINLKYFANLLGNILSDMREQDC